MGSSSDEDHPPDVDDYDYNSENLSEESEDDGEVSENEAEVIEGGWNLISDIFTDTRETPAPEYLGGPCGVSKTHKDRFTSPGNTFKQFFDSSVVGKLCEWTNQRAEIFFAEHPEKSRKVNSVRWKNVNENDMYTFLALTFVMGLVQKPRMALYWSKDWLLGGPPIFCKEVMSRDRFFSILKFLLFSPPDMKKRNSQTRIEPFLSLLRDKCKAVVTPGERVAVDAPLLLWKSRLCFQKSKNDGFGMKVFVLCLYDPNWQGYSWNFEVCCEKGSFKTDDARATTLSKSEKNVTHLMRELLDEGRHVLTNNLYTSLSLANYFEMRSTTVTGVVQSKRGLPKEITQAPLEKSQCIFARKGNALSVRCEGQKDTIVLTTKYKAAMVDDMREYFGNEVLTLNKPIYVDESTKKMDRMYMADQFIDPHHREKKSLVWLKKIGLHFCFRIALNAYIAWKNVSNSKLGFMDFLHTLAKDLLRDHNPGCQKVFHAQDDVKRFLTPSTHQFIKWDKVGKRKRCRMCYPKRRDTSYFCPACPEEPGLCSMTHYRQWHNEEGASVTKARPEGADKTTVKSENLSQIEGVSTQRSTCGKRTRTKPATHNSRAKRVLMQR